MDCKDILTRVDHTLLTPTATWEQIRTLCDEALAFSTACVCIPPRYVRKAAERVGNNLKICTVVGFPNGYSAPEVKVFEAEDAIRAGADEIDMVISLGLAKAGDWEGVLNEIRAVKASCKGRILKVIVEACQLTQEEKIAACRVVSMSGADFIKTSTGFSTGGATVEDVKLFRQQLSPDVRIKAAGGIRTFAQAEAMLQAGADRIGASSLVALARG
jgi:deoxyribose-phosphate aldolase